MKALSIITGVPLSEEKCLVIAQPNLPHTPHSQVSIVFELPRDQRDNPLTLNWIATYIESDFKQPPTYFIAGPEGCVGVLSQSGYKEEAIGDYVTEGPDIHGVIRGLRNIENNIFSVGMGRQVYARTESNEWIHMDQGVIDSATSHEVSGFNAIDGLSRDFLYAVGFNGEIWNFCKNKWTRIESPTNLALYAVKVLTDNTVYAVGQKGSIVRGNGSQWEIIDQAMTDDDFWDVECFKENLYIVTKSSLFHLTEDNSLEQVDIDIGERNISCKVLKTNKSSLWSFGETDIMVTEDCEKWRAVFRL